MLFRLFFIYFDSICNTNEIEFSIHNFVSRVYSSRRHKNIEEKLVQQNISLPLRTKQKYGRHKIVVNNEQIRGQIKLSSILIINHCPIKQNGSKTERWWFPKIEYVYTL